MSAPMIDHLQGLVLSVLFNPVFLGLLIALYIVGGPLGVLSID